MAKKKSRSKKKKSKPKSETEESSEEEPEEASEEAAKEKLYDWIAEGYNVDPLVEAVKTKDEKKIDEMFIIYEKNIERMEECKQKLARMEFDRKSPDFLDILEHFNNPEMVDEVEKFMMSLKSDPKIKELRVELASLNVAGFEKEAGDIVVKLRDPELVDECEKDINALRRRIKEKFFEEAFEDVVVAPDGTNAPVAETIFLLHKDGTLLAVKSKVPPDELDKRLLSRMVMAIREQMFKAINEGEHVHTLAYEGHSIILEESVHLYAAIIIVGEARPAMYKIILKALQIMEKILNKELDDWKGDRQSVGNLDQYTSAIFRALEKLK